MPHPALLAGAATLYVPDPLLCSASYLGAEVSQLVFALPQGAIVLLDASSSLSLHVLAVPHATWASLAGICIDGEHEQVVLLDAAGPSFLRIDLADVRAGRAKFLSAPLPSAWSTVRGIAFDVARERIVGFEPATGDLLQHSAEDPSPGAGTLRPVPEVLAFGFAPAESLDQDLFVSSGDQRLLTSQWTWNSGGIDVETATLRATIATSSWSPSSPDPSGVAYDPLFDRLMLTDGEVDEMTIYAGVNFFEPSRTGILARTSATVGYTPEPAGVALDTATRTFYLSDDDRDKVYVVAAGPDGLLNTADDSVRSFSVGNFTTDPEDVAFDNTTRDLWVIGGDTVIAHKLQPGPNGVFDGTAPNGDDVLVSFDLAPFGATDPEGIAIRPSDGGIYVAGKPRTLLLHLNALGQLLRTITLPSTGLIKPAGITWAPSTVGPGDSLFLVDRGVDNDLNPNENDGLLLEYGVSLAAPTNQPPVVDAGPDVTIVGSAAASLAGTANDDGLPGPLTIQWSLVSGPGTVTFTAPTQAATNATFSVTGSYTCELTASDSEFTRTDVVVVTVQAPPTGTILERAVAASSDDAEEGTTAVNRTSSDLEMVVDGSVSQVVGVRFQNLTIPAGAVITSAYVQFTTDTTKSTATQLTIAGQASDSAAEFRTTASSISTRPRTTATVAWAPVPWTVVNEAGLNQRTPNLGSVVQEIVNRPGWISGNAMVFVITGTGCRIATAYDHSPAAAAKLIVNYQSSAPVNQPPVVDAGPDVTIVITSAASLAGSISDDGLNAPLTIQWSKLSGPGTVSFTAPTQAATSASFSVAGSYTVQLSCFDGEFTRTDTAVVTVEPPVNQAPVVSAGPDVSILSTASAQLAGSVSDDGLPGGPLTIQWSKLSGPGTATFAAPAQAATNVSFSVAGSYTLQLSASDGALTSTDTVVVTVQQAPTNQAPVVSAGPDVTVLITSPASLVGTISDDGLPGPLAIQWSKLTGPGTATFTAPAAATTDVSFSALGVYTLRLSASDGALTTTDTVAVTVEGSGSVVRSIATGHDDAEELPTAVTRGSNDIEMMVDGTVTHAAVGLRFTNVVIPRGAVVTSAYVQFTAKDAQSAPTQLTIAGHASDNAGTFLTTAGSISNRPRTAATVGWAPAPWTIANEAGPNQRTPNLASIVQEITNRAGWTPGNAMVFVISGTGCRNAAAYDLSPGVAAQLIVSYQ
ncbi:MAG TPA: hypothetical protein VF384_13435 [Planctomycetota bacterium]